MKKNIFGWFYQPFCIYSSSQLESQQKGECFSRVLTLKLILRLLWASLGRSHWQSDSPIGSRYLKGRFARASVGTCRFPAGSENPPNRSSLSRSRAGSTDRSSWSIETRGICINQRAGSTDRSSWSIVTRGICINQVFFFTIELKWK